VHSHHLIDSLTPSPPSFLNNIPHFDDALSQVSISFLMASLIDAAAAAGPPPTLILRTEKGLTAYNVSTKTDSDDNSTSTLAETGWTMASGASNLHAYTDTGRVAGYLDGKLQILSTSSKSSKQQGSSGTNLAAKEATFATFSPLGTYLITYEKKVKAADGGSEGEEGKNLHIYDTGEQSNEASDDDNKNKKIGKTRKKLSPNIYLEYLITEALNFHQTHTFQSFSLPLPSFWCQSPSLQLLQTNDKRRLATHLLQR
jgi:hypothetical protein